MKETRKSSLSTAASTPTNAPVQRPTAPDTPPATTPGHAKSGHPEHATRNPKPRINTGGPHTAEGKATAARHATFHGIYSAVPVIPGLEADAQWTAHRLGIAATLNPQGQLEEVLVERIAALLWRLRRVLRYETNAAATAQEEALANVAYQRRVEVERLGLPGLPGRTPLFSIAGWTAAHVRRCLAHLAAATGHQPQQLVDKTLDCLRTLLPADPVEPAGLTPPDDADPALVRLRRQRLLPPPDVLDRVVRYEAHLNRQLAAALRQLDALQSRRLTYPPSPRLPLPAD